MKSVKSKKEKVLHPHYFFFRRKTKCGVWIFGYFIDLLLVVYELFWPFDSSSVYFGFIMEGHIVVIS